MQNKNKRQNQRTGRAVSLGLAVVVLVAVPLLIGVNSHKNENLSGTESSLCDTVLDTPTEISATEISSEEPETTEPEGASEVAAAEKSLGKFTLTAYCPCVECCGIWSANHPSRIGTDYIQKTASGTAPKAGRTIGVDPEVIPFGTAVIINGHEYVAEDRGGGVKGNSIDIFFDDHNEALEFGRQTAEVFIKN